MGDAASHSCDFLSVDGGGARSRRGAVYASKDTFRSSAGVIVRPVSPRDPPNGGRGRVSEACARTARKSPEFRAWLTKGRRLASPADVLAYYECSSRKIQHFPTTFGPSSGLASSL